MKWEKIAPGVSGSIAQLGGVADGTLGSGRAAGRAV